MFFAKNSGSQITTILSHFCFYASYALKNGIHEETIYSNQLRHRVMRNFLTGRESSTDVH